MTTQTEANAAATRSISPFEPKLITGFDLADKKVLLRLDLNLPIRDGVIQDFTRLDRARPTIEHIVQHGGQVVILAHLGRPGGQYIPEYSFAPLVDQISAELDINCALLDHKGVLPLPNLFLEQELADVLIVDNTRFFSGELSGDPDVAKAFASLGDVFCLDAFSVAHRSHASVTGLESFLPCCAGLSLRDEVVALEQALLSAERPLAAIIGGAKVSTKIAVLGNLIPKVDCLVVGGGMANTFLRALGYQTGASLVEEDQVMVARDLLALAERAGCKIMLPSDVATHTEFAATEHAETCDINDIDPQSMILDFGPGSAQAVVDMLTQMKTVLWNGPLGAFEIKPFEEGSVAVANAVARMCRDGAINAVAGGGDTLALLNQAGIASDFTFCSTGGGAFLEWLEGQALPGLTVLF